MDAGREPQMNSFELAVQLMALSTLPAGEQGVVASLNGGHEFGSRVANLGFTPGATLRVLQNRGRGPVLVSVRGALVALGRAEADKVTVQSCAPAAQ
jgi:ferrous iron transport protein A